MSILGEITPSRARTLTFSRPASTTLSFAVDTVALPRYAVTSVFSPFSTPTATRDSRSIEAVAASVATVELEAAVETLIAPGTIVTWLQPASHDIGRLTSKADPA